MPTPLKPNELIYVDRKQKPADYAMPSMQAAFDHYSLGYLVSGDRKWFSYEKILAAHPGCLGITKPNVFHRNLPLSDMPYDRYLVKFRIEALEPVLKLIGKNTFDNFCCQHYLSFSPDVQRQIQTQLEDMRLEYEKNSPYSQLILQGMLHRLILMVYEEHLPPNDTVLQFQNFDARIHDALIYLEKNLEYAPSLEEIAAHVALSPSHFSRLFKSVNGCSFSDYVTLTRLQHAQILLARTTLTLGEVAAKCGFANGNYMSTVFQNKLHCSPTAFRKQLLPVQELQETTDSIR